MAEEDDIVANRFNAKETQLVKCLTRFSKFSNTIKNPKDAPDLSQALFQQLSRDLAVYEQSMQAVNLGQDSNQTEIEQYNEAQKIIDTNIASVSGDISSLKSELEKEKVIRKQKEEYDLLMTQINKFPSRTATQNEITKLNSELRTHQAEEVRLQKELNDKQRQFGLFFHSLAQLSSVNRELQEKEANEKTAKEKEEADAATDAEMNAEENVEMKE